MRLQLYKSDYIDRDFVNWLLLKIPFVVLSKLTAKTFVRSRDLLRSAGVNVDPRRIILTACRYMYIVELKDSFIVDIKRNIMFGNSNNTIRELCSIIEYGNMHTPGTHVFSDAFKETIESLPLLYSEYLSELI